MSHIWFSGVLVDGGGTLYYVIGPSSGWSDPSAAEVKAGQLSGGGAATASGSEAARTTTGEQIFASAATGLTSGTLYRVAFVWSDGTNDSDVEVSDAFRTVTASTLSASVGAAGVVARVAALARALSAAIGVAGSALRITFSSLQASMIASAAMVRAMSSVDRTLEAAAGAVASSVMVRGLVRGLQGAGGVAATVSRLGAFARSPVAAVGGAAAMTRLQVNARTLAAEAGVVFRRALRSWAYTTPTYVNSTSGNGEASSTTIASSALSVTAGNLLVVTVGYDDFSTTCSLSDTAGNEWFALPRYQQGVTFLHVHTFYAWDCKGHASNVVTATFGATRPHRLIAVTQYAGADVAADPYVSHAANSGNGANDTTYASTGLAATRGGLLYGGLAVYNVFTGGWDPGDWVAADGEAQREDNQSVKVFDRIFDNPDTYDLSFTRLPGDSSTLNYNFVTVLFQGRGEAGVFLRTLTAVAELSSALRRRLPKSVAGAAGVVGAVLRTRFAGLVAAAGAVASSAKIPVLSRVLSASAGAAGSFLRRLGRVMTASAAAAAAKLRRLEAALLAAPTVAGTLTSASAVARELVAAAGATAAFIWLSARLATLAAAAAVEPVVARQVRLVRRAGVAVGASFVRAVSMTRAAAGAVAGGLSRAAGTTLDASASAAAALTRLPGKTLSAAVAAVASARALLNRVLVASTEVAGQASRRVGKILAALRTVRARLFNGLEQTLVATIGVLASLWRSGAVPVGRLMMRLVVRPAVALRRRFTGPTVGARSKGVKDE